VYGLLQTPLDDLGGTAVHDLLFGTALLAAFLGGVVALLAPCCISVMLPAYLATGLRRRGGVLAAALLFSAGVATVILPIGLGAHAISAAVAGHHLLVFSAGGIAMLASGLAVLAGWSPKLPTPGGRTPVGSGYAAVYGLGVFSGAASSCCAPVLAGVVVLSGAATSFPAALAVSGTYVAGMVSPLLALALVWDRAGRRETRLLKTRTVTLRLGPVRRSMPLGTAASGILLAGMGILTLVSAVNGPDMAATGWRLRLDADLQHWATQLQHALNWLPGWATATALCATAVLLIKAARRAGRATDHHHADDCPANPPGADATAPSSCCSTPAPSSDPVLTGDSKGLM
jgi:cytochrome c biogenesis protein CcdA